MVQLEVRQVFSERPGKMTLPFCVTLGYLADQNRIPSRGDSVDGADEAIDASREETSAVSVKAPPSVATCPWWSHSTWNECKFPDVPRKELKCGIERSCLSVPQYRISNRHFQLDLASPAIGAFTSEAAEISCCDA